MVKAGLAAIQRCDGELTFRFGLELKCKKKEKEKENAKFSVLG